MGSRQRGHFIALAHPFAGEKLSGIRKNPCSNIYSFSYLDEDFIEGRNETNLVV